jgi:hypothetical protein
MMTAECHAFAHTLNAAFWVVYANVHEPHKEPELFRLPYCGENPISREGGLDGEALFAFNVSLGSTNDLPRRGNCASARVASIDCFGDRIRFQQILPAVELHSRGNAAFARTVRSCKNC